MRLLHQHRKELDMHAEFLYSRVDLFSREDTPSLDICREVIIRNSITTFLSNYVEYLAMSGDFDHAKLWYDRALFVAETLHARQVYYDLLVYRIARFSLEDTGTGMSFTDYAQHITEYAKDADK